VANGHGRQEFSVDDETDEVEEDLGQRHRGATGSTGFAAMRRHSQLLRRRTTPQTALSNVDSTDDEPTFQQDDPPSEEQETEEEEDGEEGTVRGEPYEASNAGSVESFTLKVSGGRPFAQRHLTSFKDRQEAINVTHPFGIRIWKPALYKKNRSVQRTAEGDIHSAPGGRVGNALFLVNILWVLLFGWWLALATLIAAITCYLFFFTYSAREYGRVLLGLAGYLWYPFGRFVELKQEEAYAEEDEGEGRSISEYEQWQAGDIEEGQTFFGPHTRRTLVGRRRESLDSVSESDSVLGTGERTGLLSGFQSQRKKRRLFGRGQWNVGRVLFFVWFYFIIGSYPPLGLFVGANAFGIQPLYSYLFLAFAGCLFSRSRWPRLRHFYVTIFVGTRWRYHFIRIIRIAGGPEHLLPRSCSAPIVPWAGSTTSILLMEQTSFSST